MKNNRVILPLIIVLLLIFLPCAIYGSYKKIEDKKENGNPNHLHFFKNKLYYYDKKDNLIGMYECSSTPCGDAQSEIDDKYNNHYEGDDKKIASSDNYAFISDGGVIELYSIPTQKVIKTFRMLKNYGTVLEGDLIIVKDQDNKYGVLNLNNISSVISLNYDYIGLSNKFNNSKLSTEKFIVNFDDEWYLIDKEENELSTPSNLPIYDYDDKYIYYINSDKTYTIKDYQGNPVNILNITYVDINGDYRIIESNNTLFVYDSTLTNILYKYDNYFENNSYTIDNNEITIKENDKKIISQSLEGIINEE